MTTFGCEPCDGMGIKIIRTRQRTSRVPMGDSDQTVDEVLLCHKCAGSGVNWTKVRAHQRAERLSARNTAKTFAKTETPKKVLEEYAGRV